MKKFLLLFLAALLVVSAATAAEKGRLRLTILDVDEVPLPRVTALLSSPDMMGTRTQMSDENGEIMFVNLTPAVYELTTTLEGFKEVTSTTIRVSLDTTTYVEVTMEVAAIEESITVTAVSPAVDASKSVISEHISQDEVDDLPVARDFVGYLQLAAGINVVPNSQGTDTPQDPAGKGGLNYSDRGVQGPAKANAHRGSRDNLYFLDGMNITGMESQTALISFNNEVIQEQELMTSGVPAEYGGGKGVVGNIVTKSGGNRFSGSVNFYTQPESFYLGFGGKDYKNAEDPTMLEGFKDNKFDTAFTLGGPFVQDKLWFFLSGQYRKNSDEFALSESASPTRELMPYDQKRLGGFGKIAFKLSPNDTFSLMYFIDKYDTSGTKDVNRMRIQQYKTELDMNVYSAYYQRVFGDNFIVDLRYGHYDYARIRDPLFPEAGVLDNVQYRAGEAPSIFDRTFGSYEWKIDDKNTRDQFSFSAEWFTGNMRLKAGLNYANEYDREAENYQWGEERASLGSMYAGATLAQLVDWDVFDFSEFNAILLPRLRAAGPSDPTFSFYDTNNDGVLSADELGAATFTTANDNGLNFTRTFEVSQGRNKVRAQRLYGYIQDDWKINDSLTLNAGVRIEKHKYSDSEGGLILSMDPVFLPRLGLSWNIGGKGTQKLTLFYGKFSDYMPFSMIHFAGDISGRVRDEQVWLNNAWYTMRVRGSAEHRDAKWTPTTEDSYSSEVSLTHEIDFGSGLVMSSQLYYRGDRNIIEDYDLHHLYIREAPAYPYANTDFDKFAFNWGFFGYPPEGPGEANYFLANLVGAKRDYYGLDWQLSKQWESGSRIIAQYSFKDAKGTSQSDGNADLQGDLVEIDPRQPWMDGDLPGNISHKIKLFGTYRTPFGLDIGALFYWNSGMFYTESLIFGPGRYDIYINYPLNATWTDMAVTGENKGPSYYQLDLKFNYRLRFTDSIGITVFLDIYNVLNNQSAIEEAYGRNDPNYYYQAVTEILMPTRFYLGARLRF
ncbi:TonB-dependent receptor domain-containing protein [Acidobacteriota bacterium]